MFENNITPTTKSLADQADSSADRALLSTRRLANEAMDGLASGVQHLRDGVDPVMARASQKASDLAHQGMDALRDGTRHVQDRARRLSGDTVGYIRDEPVKAVLIAAAAGAVLAGLLSLMTRPRRQG